AHPPLPDTEDPSAPRPVGCRAGITPGGIPIALDASSVRALWRPAGSTGWTTIPLASTGADSFAGTLPALGAAGDAEYLPRAGRDSFAVALGAGLAPGQRLTYRFVARDRAAAANLAYSTPAPETLRVDRGWWDDFENGDDGFTHAPQWYSYRDAWHLTSED